MRIKKKTLFFFPEKQQVDANKFLDIYVGRERRGEVINVSLLQPCNSHAKLKQGG